MGTKHFIRPAAVTPGSRIAIIAPATIVKAEYIDGAAEYLAAHGYEPLVMPHAKGPASGSYASSLEHRLEDFNAAWSDPGVDAVLCARGGYGTAHLLPYLDPVMVRDNAKWLVGFSDISALHAYLTHLGIESLHGPMAKHLCEQPDNRATRSLFHRLANVTLDYRLPADSHYNRPGTATGRLAGGNLAVINGLAATPYDVFARAAHEDVILFIEDISEAIYAVERMLWRLYMGGTLHRIRGLVVGQFTEYRPDRNFHDMEAMIDSVLTRAGIDGIPVAFNFPAGHVDDNLALPLGTQVALSVTPDGVVLREADV